nr:hypothetical protein [Tanacetum cinerariifolium]
MDQLPDDMIACVARVESINYVRVVLSKYRYCSPSPPVSLFRVFYKVSKQGHWFSFEKRVGKGVGGQVFRQTFSGLKGLKKRFFFLDRRAILNAMAWRHHDSDVNNLVPEDGFDASDVQMLTEQVVDLRPVPSGLLFQAGLATTWDFPGFRPTFKDTEGNAVTMSEYLHTSPLCLELSFRKGLPSPLKTGLNRILRRERERQRQGNDGEEGSRPVTKRKKPATHKDGHVASEATSSPQPLRAINPADPFVDVAETAESREDRSPLASPHGSANPSMHNYSDSNVNEGTGTLRLGTSEDPSRRAMTTVDTEVVQPFPTHQTAHHSPMVTRSASPSRSIQRECGETVGKLVQARLDLAHSSHLYTTLSERHKAVKSEHESCAGRLETLRSQNDELSQANRDQALRIRELKDELARKDSALVYVERLNVERAQEKEKLVSQLGRAEMENFDCVRKLLPTAVERLLQSHEYKRSLSEPFNLTIQAGWGKGLAEERSGEDLLELMGRMKGFDVHADTKIKVEYDKLFERRYPYLEKNSRGFRHSVSNLLKVYPDSLPSGQAPSTSAPNQPQD